MKELLILLCLYTYPLLDAFSHNRFDSLRIVGGTDAPEGLYPYQVSVQVEKEHHCGGSILNEDYVLTAAHCLELLPNIKLVSAVVGITKLNEVGSRHGVLKVHIHEEWDSQIIKNDIALMKVEKITFSSKVAPIALDTVNLLEEDVVCTVSGWGLTAAESTTFPNNLQHLNTKTISFEKCKNMNTVGVDVEKEICTLNKIGQGTCRSDSGGPLVRNVDGVRKQLGIVSWGEKCAGGLPDVFVRVSSYIEWIQGKCNNCVKDS